MLGVAERKRAHGHGRAPRLGAIHVAGSGGIYRAGFAHGVRRVSQKLAQDAGGRCGISCGPRAGRRLSAADTAINILNKLETDGGAEEVSERLMEARRRDPQAQLFPEITASIVGADYLRDGNIKAGIEVLKLVLMAYPDSADANDNLADAYLADGKKDVARKYAQKALTLLDSHTLPASSWDDTEQFRGEVRRAAQGTISKASAAQ